VFFWSDPDRAQYMRMLIRARTHEPYEILQVQAGKIPCQCWEADFDDTDRLFAEIRGRLDDAEGCAGIIAPLDEGEEWEKFCDELEGIAKGYYEGMKPFTGKPKHGKEILCGCDIPREAVLVPEAGNPGGEGVEADIICAWCGKHMGTKMVDPGSTPPGKRPATHGICEECFKKMTKGKEPGEGAT
jgi:hypothetical protein